MKLTKEMLCYHFGFNSAVHGIMMTDHEIEIAWNVYNELPEDCTDAEMDIAIAKCAYDIIACIGSLKE